MATNAESALNWLNSGQRSKQEILDVVLKLESRITDPKNSNIDLSGTLEALEVLSDEIEDKNSEDTQPNIESINLSSNPEINLDSSNLGDAPSIEPELLSPGKKRERFLKLKSEIK